MATIGIANRDSADRTLLELIFPPDRWLMGEGEYTRAGAAPANDHR
jgi:hypothetical protein